jgi:hypothetical protein
VTRSTLVAFAAGCLVASRRRGGGPRRPRTVTLRGRPDSARRPADGIVAEASIVARLLRLRLLTLDATILVSPAVVTAPAAQPRSAAAPRGDLRWTHAADAPAQPVGKRLAEAARSVDASAATLAATRRRSARVGSPGAG